MKFIDLGNRQANSTLIISGEMDKIRKKIRKRKLSSLLDDDEEEEDDDDIEEEDEIIQDDIKNKPIIKKVVKKPKLQDEHNNNNGGFKGNDFLAMLEQKYANIEALVHDEEDEEDYYFSDEDEEEKDLKNTDAMDIDRDDRILRKKEQRERALMKQRKRDKKINDELRQDGLENGFVDDDALDKIVHEQAKAERVKLQYSNFYTHRGPLVRIDASEDSGDSDDDFVKSNFRDTLRDETNINADSETFKAEDKIARLDLIKKNRERFFKDVEEGKKQKKAECTYKTSAALAKQLIIVKKMSIGYYDKFHDDYGIRKNQISLPLALEEPLLLLYDEYLKCNTNGKFTTKTKMLKGFSYDVLQLLPNLNNIMLQNQFLRLYRRRELEQANVALNQSIDNFQEAIQVYKTEFPEKCLKVVKQFKWPSESVHRNTLDTIHLVMQKNQNLEGNEANAKVIKNLIASLKLFWSKTKSAGSLGENIAVEEVEKSVETCLDEVETYIKTNLDQSIVSKSKLKQTIQQGRKMIKLSIKQRTNKSDRVEKKLNWAFESNIRQAAAKIGKDAAQYVYSNNKYHTVVSINQNLSYFGKVFSSEILDKEDYLKSIAQEQIDDWLAALFEEDEEDYDFTVTQDSLYSKFISNVSKIATTSSTTTTTTSSTTAPTAKNNVKNKKLKRLSSTSNANVSSSFIDLKTLGIKLEPVNYDKITKPFMSNQFAVCPKLDLNDFKDLADDTENLSRSKIVSIHKAWNNAFEDKIKPDNESTVNKNKYVQIDYEALALKKNNKSNSGLNKKQKISSTTSTTTPVGVKKKRDPNKPINAKTARSIYIQDYADKAKLVDQSKTKKELKALGAEAWKSETKEEIAKFQELAKADKLRHSEEMKTYLNNLNS